MRKKPEQSNKDTREQLANIRTILTQPPSREAFLALCKQVEQASLQNIEESEHSVIPLYQRTYLNMAF